MSVVQGGSTGQRYHLTSAEAAKLTALSLKCYGEFYEYDNANVLAIDTADTYHAAFNSGVVVGLADGWTFSAGEAGTFSAIADLGVVGGVNRVRLTTGGAHTLVAGQMLNLTSSTVAGYLTQAATADKNENFYKIANISDNTHIDIVSANLGTASGKWRKGASLVAGASAAGVYKLAFSATITPTNANKVWKMEARVNVDPVDKAVGENTAAATPRQLVSSCFIDIVAGDRLTLSLKNKTDATDVTIVHVNMNVERK